MLCDEADCDSVAGGLKAVATGLSSMDFHGVKKARQLTESGERHCDGRRISSALIAEEKLQAFHSRIDSNATRA